MIMVAIFGCSMGSSQCLGTPEFISALEQERLRVVNEAKRERLNQENERDAQFLGYINPSTKKQTKNKKSKAQTDKTESVRSILK